MSARVLALSGGVGGAKLALGLSQVLDSGELAIVANTGDDFEHLGLHVSPDIDTLIYTLAGMANPELGWGIKDETWNFMAALKAAGGEDWFQLGDKDLVTHVLRTNALKEGRTLSQITRDVCQAYGVTETILPMSNDPIRTSVHTEIGTLDFQHYFVRERCAPKVTGFQFVGIESAGLNPEIDAILAGSGLEAIVICPSNPFVSVDPILKTGGFLEKAKSAHVPIIAVSPIVGGKAIKGPAAKMMEELNIPKNVEGVANHYQAFIDALIIDETDRAEMGALSQHPFKVRSAQTIMKTLEDKIALAEEVLALAHELKI